MVLFDYKLRNLSKSIRRQDEQLFGYLGAFGRLIFGTQTPLFLYGNNHLSTASPINVDYTGRSREASVLLKINTLCAPQLGWVLLGQAPRECLEIFLGNGLFSLPSNTTPLQEAWNRASHTIAMTVRLSEQHQQQHQQQGTVMVSPMPPNVAELLPQVSLGFVLIVSKLPN